MREAIAFLVLAMVCCANATAQEHNTCPQRAAEVDFLLLNETAWRGEPFLTPDQDGMTVGMTTVPADGIPDLIHLALIETVVRNTEYYVNRNCWAYAQNYDRIFSVLEGAGLTALYPGLDSLATALASIDIRWLDVIRERLGGDGFTVDFPKEDIKKILDVDATGDPNNNLRVNRDEWRALGAVYRTIGASTEPDWVSIAGFGLSSVYQRFAKQSLNRTSGYDRFGVFVDTPESYCAGESLTMSITINPRHEYKSLRIFMTNTKNQKLGEPRVEFFCPYETPSYLNLWDDGRFQIHFQGGTSAGLIRFPVRIQVTYDVPIDVEEYISLNMRVRGWRVDYSSDSTINEQLFRIYPAEGDDACDVSDEGEGEGEGIGTARGADACPEGVCPVLIAPEEYCPGSALKVLAVLESSIGEHTESRTLEIQLPVGWNYDGLYGEAVPVPLSGPEIGEVGTLVFEYGQNRQLDYVLPIRLEPEPTVSTPPRLIAAALYRSCESDLAVVGGAAQLLPQPCGSDSEGEDTLVPFLVNSLGDAPDANPGDGIAETEPGNGVATLRAIIEEANASAIAALVEFSLKGTIVLEAPLPKIEQPFAIFGPGADQLIIDAGGEHEIFFVHRDVRAEFYGITVANGRARGGDGGAGGEYVFVRKGGAGGGSGCGGCFYSDGGEVVLRDMIFSGCMAQGGKGGAANDLPSGERGPGFPGGDASHGLGYGGAAIRDPGINGGGGAAGYESYRGGSGGRPGGGSGGASPSEYSGSSGGSTDGFGGVGEQRTGLYGSDRNTRSGAGGGGAGLGGAVFARAGTMKISNCHFEGNTATGGLGGEGPGDEDFNGDGKGLGAAIFAYPGAKVIAKDNVFLNNSASHAADNPDAFGIIDGPTIVESITLQPGNFGNAREIVFLVNFNRPVSGVTINDFMLRTSRHITGAAILGVTGGPQVYEVRVFTGSGQGTIAVDVVDNGTILSIDDGTGLGGFEAGSGGFSDGQEFVPNRFHSADVNRDGRILLGELMRVIQLFNSVEFHCGIDTEDGYETGPGDTACTPHSSDFDTQDWSINLGELLRTVQFFNSGGYAECDVSGPPTEDGFCVEAT